MPTPRPRVGKFGTYYPAKYAAWKKALEWKLLAMRLPPLTGLLSVSIDFDMAIPASWTKKRRSAVLRGSEAVAPVGDLDNLGKGPMDGMTAARIWGDDRQVVRLALSKRYAEKDQIRVSIDAIERP